MYGKGQKMPEYSSRDKARIIYLLLFGIPFLIYAFLAPQYVSTEDDALFTLSAYFAGVSHPPGYPLHTIICFLFQNIIPFGTPAYKAHLVSSLFGALSICALYWVLIELKVSVKIAISCAVFFGFIPQFLSQAVIAEVYTLNTFLLLLTMGQVIYINENSSYKLSDKRLFFLGLSLGFGLSNHWPLFILGGLGIFIIFLPSIVKSIKRVPLIFLGVFAGLLPYLWLVTNSSNTGISFYGSIDTLKEFLFYVLRKGYSEADSGVISGVGERLRFLLFFGKELTTSFYFAGPVMAIIGIYKSIELRKKNEYIGLIVCFLGPSVLLLFLLDFDFTALKAMVFRVYPIFSYAIITIWIAFFLESLRSRLPLYIFNIILPGLIAAHVWIQSAELSRFPFGWAETVSEKILSLMSHESIIFTNGDLETGVLSYFRYVQERRNDVDIYNSEGLLLGNRLFDPLETPPIDRINRMVDFSVNYPGDVFFTTLIVDGTPITDMVIATKLEREQQGFFYRCEYPEEHHSFFMSGLVDLSTPDLFAREYMKIYSMKLGRMLMLSDCIEEPFRSELKGSLDANPYAKLGMASQLMDDDSYNPREVIGYLSTAFDLCPGICDRPTNAQIYSLIGLVNLSLGNNNEAKKLFQLSVREWPADTNESHDYLKNDFPTH